MCSREQKQWETYENELKSRRKVESDCRKRVDSNVSATLEVEKKKSTHMPYQEALVLKERK